eukprot:9046304-Alexandrium_andersonii.AAC.1
MSASLVGSEMCIRDRRVAVCSCVWRPVYRIRSASSRPRLPMWMVWCLGWGWGLGRWRVGWVRSWWGRGG